MRKLVLAGWLLLCASVASAETKLDVYVREGCPHCAEAERYLDALAAERPDLRIVYHSVERDPSAREALLRLSRDAGIWPPGVPTFVVEGRVLVGFVDTESTGPALAALIAGPGAEGVETRLLGRLSATQLGLPLFALALGLVDGFNPCATWVLFFLLSLLVRLEDRRRMAVIASTFVVTSGAVYYAFMAAWLNLFLWVGLSDPVRIGLALLALAVGALDVKDFAATGRGPSLAIPAGAKPGLFGRMRAVLRANTLPASLGAVIGLAVLVNFVELLCTAGLPAVFTAVLAQHDLSTAAYHGYLGLYIAGYVADDSAMVAMAVLALSSRRLSESAGRWLKLLAGVVMLGLGAVMLLRPGWLI